MGACSIVPLSDTLLEEITDIHMRAFPGRALTCLGRQAVRRYYQTLLVSGQFRMAVGAANDAHLLGYLIGGELRGSMGAFLKRNFAYLLLQILLHPTLLLQPIVRDRLNMAFSILRSEQRRARQARGKAPGMRRRKRTFSVLVIAVDPQAQHCGVGKLLMTGAEEVALENGYEQMHLSVDVHNSNAVRFYEGIGWVRVHPENWHGSMIKPLALAGARAGLGEQQFAAR